MCSMFWTAYPLVLVFVLGMCAGVALFIWAIESRQHTRRARMDREAAQAALRG